MKPPSMASVDSIASQYVRIKYSNNSGYVKCITCGNIKHWKDIDCGHFIKREHLRTRYDIFNMHPQCLTEDSKVRMFNGINISIKDVETGDKIWTFDSKSFKRKVGFIKSKSSFIPTKLYEVELEDGKKFYATADHKLVANNKWEKIKNMLHNVTTYNIMEL